MIRHCRWMGYALLLAALSLVVQPAHAESGDQIHIGQTVHVAAGESVQDAVCFFCNVLVDGKVTGDVVAIFGNVHLSGDAQHDVVNIFGSLRADRGASIEGDVVSVFGSVRLGDAVAVGGDLISLFGALRLADSASVAGETVVRSVWLVLLPLALLALALWGVLRGFRKARIQFEKYSVHR